VKPATALYAALAVVFTWPLVLGLTHDVPGDFGDPLLNAWILSWDATHLGRGWWSANIFHPHPLALAYSEHLLPQALQILPIYAVTRNPILCYNLLFLSTFVLSGLGAFLLARDLTGSREAAIVAGAAFAFAPYRVAATPHLQVLSSAWMPFALFGFRRYFARGAATQGHLTDRAATQGRPYLVGAAVAWWLQNLSCGYYLVFFSPVVAIYLAWELTTRSLWRDRRVLLQVGSACVVVAAATLPFLLPYLRLRELGFSPRSLAETMKFSADVYAYLTADPNGHVWGWLQAWPHPEGALFPGLTIVALAVAGVARALQASAEQPPGRAAGRLALQLTAVGAAALLTALLLGFPIHLAGLRIASFPRALAIVAIAAVAVLAASPLTRRALTRWLSTPTALFTLIALFAIAMSWGPEIHARGRMVAATSLYGFFYRHVPGFDGLRVPARFDMILTLALAMLAAAGVMALRTWLDLRTAAILATIAIVLESMAIPIPLNQNSTQYTQPGLAPLPASITPPPKVYDVVRTLPEDAAIVELPLGEPAFDVRYMFFSTVHWRRLVNGYSGGAPKDYEELDQALQDALARPERAWAALVRSRATHVIVHEAYYDGDRGERIAAWLRSRGAHQIATLDRDIVFEMR